MVLNRAWKRMIGGLEIKILRLGRSLALPREEGGWGCVFGPAGASPYRMGGRAFLQEMLNRNQTNVLPETRQESGQDKHRKPENGGHFD